MKATESSSGEDKWVDQVGGPVRASPNYALQRLGARLARPAR
jgi:hypothetical protein